MLKSNKTVSQPEPDQSQFNYDQLLGEMIDQLKLMEQWVAYEESHLDLYTQMAIEEAHEQVNIHKALVSNLETLVNKYQL